MRTGYIYANGFTYELRASVQPGSMEREVLPLLVKDGAGPLTKEVVVHGETMNLTLRPENLWAVAAWDVDVPERKPSGPKRIH